MWFAACMEDYDKPYYDNEDQATIEALPELPQTKVFVSRQKLFDDFKELWDAQNFQSQQEVTGDTTGQQTQKSTVEDGDALLSKEDQEKADFMARLLETDADVEDKLTNFFFVAFKRYFLLLFHEFCSKILKFRFRLKTF